MPTITAGMVPAELTAAAVVEKHMKELGITKIHSAQDMDGIDILRALNHIRQHGKGLR